MHVVCEVSLPVQLISFPLHCPDDKHVLVTFPDELVYPVWQEYKQLDPKTLAQEGVNLVAFAGVTSEGQEMTERNDKKISVAWKKTAPLQKIPDSLLKWK